MKYINTSIGNVSYDLLDLDQKEVEKRIIADMESGVDVYYDRRWEVTDYLTEWLENHHEVYQDKRVLVLGAGIGAETLVLGRLAKNIALNDLSSTALELCEIQLKQNDISNSELLIGRYEELDLPQAELIVASFLVYNTDTLKAMRAFIKTNQCQFILMNENLAEFRKLLDEFKHKVIFEEEGAKCVMIEV